MSAMIRVADLVGRDVDGLKAIVTSPKHRYQYPQGVPIVTLRKVYRHKMKIRHSDPKPSNWLRIEFDRVDAYHGCNFSGKAEPNDWRIELL